MRFGRLGLLTTLVVTIILSASGTALYYQARLNSINSRVADLQDQIRRATNESQTIRITRLSPDHAKSNQPVTLEFIIALSRGPVRKASIDWGDGSASDLMVNMTSASMCPLTSCQFPVGTLMMFRPTDPSRIQAGPDCGTQINSGSSLGSIIVFRPVSDQPDFLVVHRVREVVALGSNQFEFKTQGDANSVCDPWTVQDSQVLGVFQYVVPSPLNGESLFVFDTHTYNNATSSVQTYTIQVTGTFSSDLIASDNRSVNISSSTPA